LHTALDLLDWPERVPPGDVLCCYIFLGEPLPKERPRFARGRVVTPKATRRYERQLRDLFRAEWWGQAGDCPTNRDPHTGPVALRVRFCRRTKVRVDLDNLIKAVLDSCQGTILANDRQVVEIHAALQQGCASPRVEVVLHRVGE
jgi:Holliday junction resolvase RusA-like endonuclease